VRPTVFRAFSYLMSYLECCEAIGRSLAQSLGFAGVKIEMAFFP
jgi:hypothetical protein